MSFKEINDLRRTGKLDEAMEKANQALESDAGNIWNKRAASWVYYEYLKKYSDPDSFHAFKENLLKLKKLQLPEDEKIVFDNSAWQIGSMVFKLQRQDPVSYLKINDMFEIIKEFQFTKPSESYSFIYKAFHKGYQNWSNYLAFAEWWDFNYFLQKDYQSEEYNGRQMRPLAEKAYVAYSKKLLEGEPLDAYGQQRKIDKKKIKDFLSMLDYIIVKYPEYKYSSFYKAKLLLALGDEQNVLSAFLPFARQKRNDFWVWDLMTDIFKDDKEVQFSCFCKALSLKTPEDFLVKIRQKFANLLIEKEMYDEANFEIEKVIETRNKKGWNTPPIIKEWVEQAWYTSANKNNNNALYEKFKTNAEEILYQDIKEDVVAVEYVNKHKNIINFIINRDRHGFFKYSSQLKNPKVGDILKVRFNKYSKNSISNIYTARKISSDTQIEAIKSFEGWFEQIPNKNFGFVDDIFVNSDIINKYNLDDSQMLKGKAILSYDKSKDKYGWKCFEVI